MGVMEEELGGGGQLVPVAESLPIQIPRVNLAGMGLGQVGDTMGGSGVGVGASGIGVGAGLGVGTDMGGRPDMGMGTDMGGRPGMGGGGARGLRLTLHGCCLPQTQTLCR